MESVLKLSSEDARKFFLNQKSYCNIRLPDYFNFQPLLDTLANDYEFSGPAKYKGCIKGFKKTEANKVNCWIYANKDSEFAWRRLQLLNPIAYVHLVFQLTDEKNWRIICKRFVEFQKNKRIKCCSIPLSTLGLNSEAGAVKHWWCEIEQESIKLAMEYAYMMTTDISDCYGSIYTHTIAWAIHELKLAKKHKNTNKKNGDNKTLLGDQIDECIRNVSYGQTNGIPQGSVLMDFIAEMVLGYADYCLSERLGREEVKDYYILRYRDDYRIFANEKETLVKIAKALNDVLADLNLKLNANKTSMSENIICDSVKLDKLSWMSRNEPSTIQKRLLNIHTFSSDFPNSGSVEKSLCKIASDLEKDTVQLANENLDVIFSILVDIAFRNPRMYPIAVVIIGKILPILNKGQVDELFAQILRKFKRIPNTEFISIWMQRLTIKNDPDRRYDSQLCAYVRQVNKNLRADAIWVNNGFNKIFRDSPVVDLERINAMSQIPRAEEAKLFGWY